MKKISFFFLFGLTVVFLSLIACSKDDDQVEGNTSSLSINGKSISKILTSQVEGNGFLLGVWYDNWYFEMEFRYNGKVANLSPGDNITDEIIVRRCEHVNEAIIDGSYEVLSGSVKVKSVSSKSVSLNFSNLKLQQYVGSTKKEVYTINGNVTYEIFD